MEGRALVPVQVAPCDEGRVEVCEVLWEPGVTARHRYESQRSRPLHHVLFSSYCHILNGQLDQVDERPVVVLRNRR